MLVSRSVAFRETIRKGAEAEGKYIRQTGGSGNYGHVKIRIEPNEPGGRASSSPTTSKGGDSSEGIHQADGAGYSRSAAGRQCWPATRVVDVKVSLFDGSYHDVDSNENGVQDCRIDGLQGSGAQGVVRYCSSR